jgi:hypothetical protein
MKDLTPAIEPSYAAAGRYREPTLLACLQDAAE